jgi:hypothetical protein
MHAIDIGWGHAMIFIDGKIEGFSIHLPGACVDDLGVWIELPAGFQQGQLCRTVDLKIAVRRGHRVEMTRASGEIEYVVDTADCVIDHGIIADVSDDHVDPISNALDVVEIPALTRIEGIDNSDIDIPASTNRCARLLPINPRPPVISTERPSRAMVFEHAK